MEPEHSRTGVEPVVLDVDPALYAETQAAMIARLDAEIDPPLFADKLVVVMPTLGHADHIAAVIQAWKETDAADDGAVLVLAFNGGDNNAEDIRTYAAYLGAEPWIYSFISEHTGYGPVANEAARWAAVEGGAPYIAVQNDDHLPRTRGWAAAYQWKLEQLDGRFGVGVVYGDDMLRGEKLCTEWAVTRSWVLTLGRMIPCLARHLYTDTSVRDLAQAAGVLNYLGRTEVQVIAPGRHSSDMEVRQILPVRIEHMHPTADKRAWSATTRAANSDERKEQDRAVYSRWATRPENSARAGLANQLAKLKALRP